MVYGKTPVVWEGKHDKISVQEYMAIAAKVREEHCLQDFWDNARSKRSCSATIVHSSAQGCSTNHATMLGQQPHLGHRAQMMTPVHHHLSACITTPAEHGNHEPQNPMPGSSKQQATNTLPYGSSFKRANIAGITEVSLNWPQAFLKGPCLCSAPRNSQNGNKSLPRLHCDIFPAHHVACC